MSQPNGDNLSAAPFNLAEKTAYEKVNMVAEHVLASLGATSKEKTLFGFQVFEKAKSDFPELNDFSKNTFLQYLSEIKNDPNSRLDSEGRRKGYYLLSESPSEVIAVDETVTQQTAQIANQARKLKEDKLYPVLQSWLSIEQGYQSDDISSNRSLGKWGNPDIAGISVSESFGFPTIEILTIEAKVSMDNWEQWIFEAVSHRRFANRSYFAFAHPDELKNKLPQDLRYYSELYNIGILVLLLDNSKFKSLIEGRIETPFGDEEVEVVELYPAPFNMVQPKYQNKFCDALGIKTAKELFKWGKSN